MYSTDLNYWCGFGCLSVVMAAGLSSLSVQAARVKATPRSSQGSGLQSATSEQQVLQLRHVDVPLVFRVFNQFIFLHEASHHCVCCRLLRNLTRPTHVAVVHSVHLRNEHLCRWRLLPSKSCIWLIIIFTVASNHLLGSLMTNDSVPLAKNSLFIEVKVVMGIHDLW